MSPWFAFLAFLTFFPQTFLFWFIFTLKGLFFPFLVFLSDFVCFALAFYFVCFATFPETFCFGPTCIFLSFFSGGWCEQSWSFYGVLFWCGVAKYSSRRSIAALDDTPQIRHRTRLRQAPLPVSNERLLFYKSSVFGHWSTHSGGFTRGHFKSCPGEHWGGRGAFGW